MSPAGRMPRARRLRAEIETGFALIAVLWAVVLLALVAANLTQSTRTETQILRNLIDNAQLRAVADGGPAAALAFLFHPDEERRWKLDNGTRQIMVGDATLSVTIADEAGKVDLNAATVPLLTALFEAVGAEAPETLAAKVADFRDPDQERTAGGAEDADYAVAGLGWRTKGAPFDDVAELRLVLGMNDALWARLAPVLTVSTQRQSPEMFRAPVLVQSAMLAQTDGTVAAGEVKGQLPYGRVVTVRSEARLGRWVFVREALIRLPDGPGGEMTVLGWRRGE